MNLRQIAASVLVLGLGISAANAQGLRYERARVLSAQPIYESVVVEQPVTRCSREIVERRVPNASVAGQTAAGAIIGAAIGRQFGDGRGQDALTVIGAIAGSAVANDRAIRRSGSRATVVREPVERCTTSYRRTVREQITAWEVEYRYRGRIYRTVSHEQPGKHIRIAVRS